MKRLIKKTAGILLSLSMLMPAVVPGKAQSRYAEWNHAAGSEAEQMSGETDPEQTDPEQTDPEQTETAQPSNGTRPAGAPEITAQSAVLMEASTGTILYEKNAEEALRPASITKIMTLILIFDALESGAITLEEPVTTSAHAKSMGGSQVFLEEGEVQTVETLIKCIVIASGNDAAVAMAEHIAGSEEAFVTQMNMRAKALGMTETVFEDCCGLTDSASHLTSARDVALMSRELIVRYPQIEKYSTIWMENIIHNTKQGRKEFCLSNTNKLLKMGNSFTVTGLKTGSTSLAKYCFSGTARQDGMELIAVIMAAPNYKVRFREAAALLNYGFASCSLYQDRDEIREVLSGIPVSGGTKQKADIRYGAPFSYLCMNGEQPGDIEKVLTLPEQVEAPVKEGDPVGILEYRMGETVIGSVEIQAAESVEAAGIGDYLLWLFRAMTLRRMDTEAA